MGGSCKFLAGISGYFHRFTRFSSGCCSCFDPNLSRISRGRSVFNGIRSRRPSDSSFDRLAKMSNLGRAGLASCWRGDWGVEKCFFRSLLKVHPRSSLNSFTWDADESLSALSAYRGRAVEGCSPGR